jgi:hypothetical protein
LLLLKGLLLSERRGLWLLLLLAWAAASSAAQESVGGGVHLQNGNHHSFKKPSDKKLDEVSRVNDGADNSCGEKRWQGERARSTAQWT